MPYIGLETNNTSAADNNLRLINNALQNDPQRAITLPAGRIYIDGTIETNDNVGCAKFHCPDGAAGYIVDVHPAYDGPRAQIVQLGTNVDCVRIKGAGAVFEDAIEWICNANNCFVIEGRTEPAAGRHQFTKQRIRNATNAFICKAGYYPYGSNSLTADESHGDLSIVNELETTDITGAIFRSENQQSVGWKFRDVKVNTLTWANETIFADIVRGGNLKVEDIYVMANKFVLFQTTEFSPNTCRLIARDVFIDRMVSVGTYFTAFKYIGSGVSSAWSDWFLDVDGYAQQYFNPASYVSAPGNLPQTHFNINIRTLYTS